MLTFRTGSSTLFLFFVYFALSYLRSTDGLLKTLIFVILSSSLLSNRGRNNELLLGLPCVIRTIGLSLVKSLVFAISVSLETLLGLRYLLLKPLPITVPTVVEAVVVVVVVLPLSLYLGARTEFAEMSCALNLDVDGVYLLDPLLRDLIVLRSLPLDMDVSVRDGSA